MTVRVDEVVTEARVVAEPQGEESQAPSHAWARREEVRRAVEQMRRDALRTAAEGYDD